MRSIDPRACPAPAQPAHSAPADRARQVARRRARASRPCRRARRVTSFSRETHARATTRPTAGEPVKRTLSTGDCASATPTSAPPWTIRTSPSGRPARASTRAIRSPARLRARGRLEGDAVAREQRPGDLPQRLREGRAAGADHAHHAVGLVGDARALGDRHRAVDPDAPAAQHLRALLGDPDQRVDRRQQLERRDLRARAALLAREHLQQLVEVVDHRLRHAAHVAGAVLHPQQRPQRLRPWRRPRRPRRCARAACAARCRAPRRWRGRAPAAPPRLRLARRCAHWRGLSRSSHALGARAPRAGVAAARRALLRPRRLVEAHAGHARRAQAPVARRRPGRRVRVLVAPRSACPARAPSAAPAARGAAPCSRTCCSRRGQRAAGGVGLRRERQVDRRLGERVTGLRQADVSTAAAAAAVASVKRAWVGVADVLAGEDHHRGAR